MQPNPNPSSDDPPPHGLAVPLPPATAAPPHRDPHHRRARSELAFRFPDDLNLAGGSAVDDLFCTYMDIEKLCVAGDWGDGAPDGDGCGEEVKIGGGGESRPKHRHSSSVDGATMLASVSARRDGVFGEVTEAKKAMTPEQLAELAAIDPKRAKRILANRQSATRSKERKARYITELERKVQTLQTEATTLSAQFTLFQRDTTGLSAENAELRVQLQALEQQAQLCDALSEALKQEVERLRLATGEISNPGENFNTGMQHVPYNPSFFMHNQQHSVHQAIQLQPQYQQPQPGAWNH